jgi:hypothetical protein
MWRSIKEAQKEMRSDRMVAEGTAKLSLPWVNTQLRSETDPILGVLGKRASGGKCERRETNNDNNNSKNSK